jgi:AraC family transcriptional regulator of adaptative response / DNA-3-methyladenine glycosylase II
MSAGVEPPAPEAGAGTARPTSAARTGTVPPTSTARTGTATATSPARIGTETPISARRARTARELARRLAGGELCLDEGADREAIRRGLLAVPGLGPAAVEDLMLHALGDPDAFPAGDLLTAARAHGLPAHAAGLIRRAEPWRPWRGYAAHLLWRAARISAEVTPDEGRG